MALKLTRLGWTSNIDPTVLDANFQKVATAFDRLMTATNGFVGTYIYEQDKVEVTIPTKNIILRAEVTADTLYAARYAISNGYNDIILIKYIII